MAVVVLVAAEVDAAEGVTVPRALRRVARRPAAVHQAAATALRPASQRTAANKLRQNTRKCVFFEAERGFYFGANSWVVMYPATSLICSGFRTSLNDGMSLRPVLAVVTTSWMS